MLLLRRVNFKYQFGLASAGWGTLCLRTACQGEVGNDGRSIIWQKESKGDKMGKTVGKEWLFVLIILMSCLITGCNGMKQEDEDKKTLTLFASNNWIKEIDRQLFYEFEEQTGVEVKLLLAPDNDYETLLGMCLAGGNSAVDIFMYPAGRRIGYEGIRNVVFDLSQEEWVNRMEDWALESVSCEGKVLGFNTWGEDYEGILYNKTFFEENGLVVPETWEDFLSLCNQISMLGTVPLYENLDTSWHVISWVEGLTPVMKQENPDFCTDLNQNPEYGFADLDSFARGLEQFRQLAAAKKNGVPRYYTDGGADEDFKASYRILTDREAVMIFTYSAYAVELKEYGSNDEWGMFPAPLLDNRTAVSNGGGIARFINKYSHNIEECRQLFDFLAQKENLEAYYKARTDLVTAAFKGIENTHPTSATKEILERSQETVCVMFTKETNCLDSDLYKYMQGLSEGSLNIGQLIRKCDAYRKRRLEHGKE